MAVVPDVVDDLVDDAASDMGASTDTAVPLMDERERYIDQLLAEIESLQVRLFPFIPFSRIRLFISFELCKMSRLVESVWCLVDKKYICVTMRSWSVTNLFVTCS